MIIAAGSSNSAAGVLTQFCGTSNLSINDDSISVLFSLPQARPLAQVRRYLSVKSNEQSTDWKDIAAVPPLP